MRSTAPAASLRRAPPSCSCAPPRRPEEEAMPRIVYVNGSFMPIEEARIPIMDRGFLFADGIYEVSAVLQGRLIDNEPHLARLDRSLKEIRIANPYSAAQWTELEEELVRRNSLSE